MFIHLLQVTLVIRSDHVHLNIQNASAPLSVRLGDIAMLEIHHQLCLKFIVCRRENIARTQNNTPFQITNPVIVHEAIIEIHEMSAVNYFMMK